MTTNSQHPNLSASTPGATLGSAPASAEETLRIVAGLPAPAGLEERVRAAMRSAHQRNLQRSTDGAHGGGRGRVLAWRTTLRPQSSWMRAAAAAAIVFVVVGGGWGVYSRVEQSRPARVLVMPRPAAPGFSGAGAIRTPQTIPGPTVPPTVQPKPVKKAAAKPGPKAASKSDSTSQAATSR